MFKAILFHLFLITFVYANESTPHIPLSYEHSIKLLHNIQKDAIYYGCGERLVYVFIDPLCPYSRKFISMIYTNQTMTQKYRYALFLYSIPRLHSQQVVSAIYGAQNPLESLFDVMLKNQTLENSSTQANEIVTEIATVAQTMQIKKRPYIIIEK